MKFDILLHRMRPGSKWVIDNPRIGKYEHIQWLDENTNLPSYEDFEKEWILYKREQEFQSLKVIRNKLLDNSDKYTIPDWPHSTQEVKQEWVKYRQNLRDLPSNTDDPYNPNWPIIPCQYNLARLRLRAEQDAVIAENKERLRLARENEISVISETTD